MKKVILLCLLTTLALSQESAQKDSVKEETKEKKCSA